MKARIRCRGRRGTVIPLLALCVVGLCGFVALAVDLGMLAASRTDSQNAADAAAVSACRQLNNKPTSVNNDLAKAVAAAKSVATANNHLAGKFEEAQIAKIEAGQYLYDTSAKQFRVSSWTDVTAQQGARPGSGSWTAMRVTLAVAQPTYFMRVFGVNSMPSGAVATAVFRPRDTAFVLDMTGSMAYASTFNFNNQSLNPDPLVPKAGHYVGVQNRLVASANQANGSGEAYSRNNFTVSTPGGLPIVRDFYFDPVNVSDPAAVAFPLTVSDGTPSLKNAFHRWSPPESGGDASTYTPPTYDFTGYNAFDNGTGASPAGPTPAPDNFGTMTDSPDIAYVGDRWRRANGSVNKADTTWSASAAGTKAAGTAIELLGYSVSSNSNSSSTTVRTAGGTTVTTLDKFRDADWEAHGYDLDVAKYRADRGNGGPLNPGTYTAPLLPAADRFVGYSMGPGYWGKTFFMWPPDPWFDPSANPASPDPDRPGFDTGGRAMCDWRRHFFLDRGNDAFDTQADANPSTGTSDGINGVLLHASANNITTANSTTNWRVNYTAVLKWIKAGPQVLPPNLRAGRVLYYSSIPDDVNTSSGSAQQRLDKAFWKRYIDYVVGYSYRSAGYLYGPGDSWASHPTSVYTSALSQWAGPGNAWASRKPYMSYLDSPNRPRLHFWFGPLSMMDFIGNAGSVNWFPGTCHEAQCWQLKAGMNAVLDDVRNNHPNDFVGLVMFAANSHNDIRRPMSQNFQSLKNSLFYPKSLLDAIDEGDVQSEIRPYTANWTSISGDELPNSNGSTDPNTGLAYAFNLLSPSAGLSQGKYGTVKGRRGAAKVVIFETDGVPNTYRGVGSSARSMDPIRRGFDTFYPPSAWSSGNIGNGVEPSMSEAVKVVRQMVKPMATGNGNGVDSGLSLPNAPARVYPIGFGDLFDTQLSPNADFRPTALRFLARVAAAGNTGPEGAVTIPNDQIISGPSETRIARLKDSLQRIFQSGVSVVLVE